MSTNIDDLIIPFEHVGAGISSDFTQDNKESSNNTHDLMIHAIEALQREPGEAHNYQSWKALLININSFDLEVSRSICYFFLVSFPLCQSIRAEWMRIELRQIVRLSKALCEKDFIGNRDVIYLEANKSCRIASFHFHNWCDGSYSVSMWFLRMIYSTIFRSGDVFSLHKQDDFPQFDEYRPDDIERIIPRAIEETIHDPDASKIWYFWIIREALQCASKSNSETKLFDIVQKLFEIVLVHPVDPIFGRFEFSFDEVKYVSPSSVAEFFPNSVAEFQKSFSKIAISGSEILEYHGKITEISSIPDSKLSIEILPRSAQCWVNLLELEKDNSTSNRLIGLMHSMLYENPFSETICLFACYHFKQYLDHDRCVDIFEKIVNQSSSSLRPVISILLSNEYFLKNNIEDALRILDAEISLIQSTIHSSVASDDIRETITMLNMQKMFLLYCTVERSKVENGAVESKALVPVREVVMQAVKSGVFSWHIFVYLCVLEVTWSKGSSNSEATRRMVTNIINQASQHAGKSVEFLHRMVDFLPITDSTADIIVAFEKMVQGFAHQSTGPMKTGSIRSVWGRFYQILKDIVPPWELDSYESRRDRLGHGYGGLIAEKSWSGDGIIEKGENENLPLSALQSLVLSSGPGGYLSLVNRYSITDDTAAQMAILSANEHSFWEMKQTAWMNCLENDDEVCESLRKIGLRSIFSLENDYARVSSTLSAPKGKKGGEEVHEFLPFTLTPVNKN